MKIISLVLLALTTMILYGCGNSNSGADGADYIGNAWENGVWENDTRPNANNAASTLAGLSPIDHETAANIFMRIEAILDADGGELWGADLHGPIVFADAESRYAVANMADIGGEIFVPYGNLYVGRIPDDIRISSYNVEFGGRRWSMVSWGWVLNHLNEPQRLMLSILHKNFHAKQPYIFEGERSWYDTSYVEELDVRITLRLEINALLSALRAVAEGDRQETLESIRNALSIRAERHRNHPDFTAHDATFEVVEGTAVFTEVMLMFGTLEERINYLEMQMYEEPDLQMFGYNTGALYALLLYEIGVDWRAGFSWEADLSAIMREAAGLDEVILFNEIHLERYGYSAIRLAEEAWQIEMERLTQEAKDAFSGSLLFLYSRGEFNDWDLDVRLLYPEWFMPANYDLLDYGRDDVVWRPTDAFGNPNLTGTVFYGDFIYTGYFGELEVTGGHILLWHLMWRHSVPAHGVEVSGNIVRGDNWVLTLNEGFELRDVGGGHFGVGEV